MKVLITNMDFHVYGGAERLIVTLANYLTDHYIESTLLTPAILPEIQNKFKETRILAVKEPFAYCKEIIHDFDVVNAHNNPAQLYHIPKRKPVVWMCNEPPLSFLTSGYVNSQEVGLVRKFVTTPVVADEYNNRRFEKIYGMDSKINAYGIDYDAFQGGDPQIAIDRFGLHNSFVLLQTAYMTFTKNQLGTVDIFKEVKKHIPEAKLVFAGFNKSDYHAQVQKKIQQEQVPDVVFSGEVPQEEIKHLYCAANVIISPIMGQGGWLNVFEAMAAGRPVVVSTDCTASSVFEANGIGFVAKNNYICADKPWLTRAFVDGKQEEKNYPDFESQILEIYDKKIDQDTKGQTWVKENLSWNKFCANMVNYFQELVP